MASPSHEKPSDAIIAAANTVAEVTDSRGRTISIKKLNPLDRMRLAELVGPENVHNDIYFGYASLAYHVQSIDGVSVPKPTAKLALEALVQRLDDDGLEAVGTGIAERLIVKEPDEEPKDQVKNS